MPWARGRFIAGSGASWIWLTFRLLVAMPPPGYPAIFPMALIWLRCGFAWASLLWLAALARGLLPSASPFGPMASM